MAFQYSSEPSGAAVSTTILLESVICLAPDLLSPMLVDDIDATGADSALDLFPKILSNFEVDGFLLLLAVDDKGTE